MIDEFLKTGSISESEKIKADERFQSLSAFSSVYGIGPNTARGLYARGLRTLEHLERYYEVWEDPQVAATSQRDAKTDDDVKDVKPVVIEEADVRGEGGTTLIRAALGYREDLAIKIPRDEVEEIGRLMAAELEEVEKGCVSIIVGGYRRGKPESNDVDIVFTHPDKEKEKGLCKKLVKRLIERGLVTHVIHQSSFREHNALRTHHWDSLEKALTVFVHPPGSSYARAHVDKHGHRLRRRIDLIFAQPEIYWTAVVGWTGSTVFERDLRLWAKNEKRVTCGIFDATRSLTRTRRRDSKMMYAQTEKEVFDIMGLPWIDPTLRNADA
ncbi:Nucleotidyltransferase [Punctularia strigosozonata HHB-11173 SS5]|uniref:Nucleotidyltransferase n=1 Tax=Punctularia strigosozonata (strain HHB-11173) TaxID=741275 RepID=UPI00044171C3|nr:Nucleotidyltransferase [Punctularia strigosozonata HHB-11173 SS5]EIN08428.1 Nucleotidyltransferase [Punctularia strigosozonata HHB-11173 SS5]